MNSYQSEKQKSVDKILQGQYLDQNKLNTDRHNIELKLYHAQEKQISIDSHNKNISSQLKDLNDLNQEGYKTSAAMDNFIATVERFNKAATLSKSDSATVASDINNAKKAIAKIVASVGSATSLGEDKDISYKLKETNTKIIHAFELISTASLFAMESTMKNAEMLSEDLVSSANDCHDKLVISLNATKQQLTECAALQQQSDVNLNEAVQNEKKCQSALNEIIIAQQSAGRDVENSISVLNHGLCIIEHEYNKISVRIDTQQNDTDSLQYAFLTDSVQGMLPLESVEKRFNDYRETSNKDNSHKTPFKIINVSYADFEVSNDIDLSGKQIDYGKEYVAYVYSDTEKKLTVATNLHKLLKTSPLPDEINFTEQNEISFSVSEADNENEYRAILIPSIFPENFQLCEKSLDNLGFYFSTQIAEHIPKSNYSVMKYVHGNKNYQTKITQEHLDNFGQVLEVDELYYIAILATNPKNNEFRSRLAVSEEPRILLKNIKSEHKDCKPVVVKPIDAEPVKPIEAEPVNYTDNTKTLSQSKNDSDLATNPEDSE